MDTEVQPGADASLEPEQIPADAEAEAVDEQELESGAESPPAEDQNLEENKDSFQERIDRLTRYRRDAEREAESLRRQWEEANAELEQLRKERAEQAAKAAPEKTLADFDYNEADYAAYLRTEAMERARETAREEAKRIAEETRQQQERDAKRAKFDKAAAKFAKDQADFYEVTQDRNLPITEEMADVIMDSDIGPNLAYYLAKHPDEAYSIARSHPAMQGRQIGMLEATLKAELSKQAKKTTDAPPPPKGKVKGTEPGFKTNPTDPSSDKMSDKEWLARREAQLAKRRNG
jgi:ribosomal protein L10